METNPEAPPPGGAAAGASPGAQPPDGAAQSAAAAAPGAAAGPGPFGLSARGRTAESSRRTVAWQGARMAAVAYANWLIELSWGKFFLLSVLFLTLSAVAFSLFFSRGGGKHPVEGGEITVHVQIVPVAEGGLAVQSAEGRHPRTLVIHPERPHAHSKASVDITDEGGHVHIDGDEDGAKDPQGHLDNPQVRVDRQGVRILSSGADADESVVIDHNGVHIEKIPHGAKAKDKDSAAPAVAAAPVAPAAPAAPLAAPGMAALAPSDLAASGLVAADPQKVAEAVEAAREEVETILQDQVDDKLAAFRLNDDAEREDWLVVLTLLVIIALIILKVVLGSKKKAEVQARQASATAAQEGLKRQLAEAQLKMMQAQVEPHFLFNTLASVDYLIETDPARASRMQKNLIQYLRAALPQMREGTSTLGREVQQCRSYLEILKVRMDERLQFSINVPQGLASAVFPPMMLITLVENAIKHGLEPKPEGGSLSVSAAISNGSLQVAVADSGLGFGAAQRGGTGVGLANVRERLQALFGKEARLHIDANTDAGTIATIVVPYRVDPSALAPGARGVPGAAGLAGAAG